MGPVVMLLLALGVDGSNTSHDETLTAFYQKDAILRHRSVQRHVQRSDRENCTGDEPQPTKVLQHIENIVVLLSNDSLHYF